MYQDLSGYSNTHTDYRQLIIDIDSLSVLYITFRGYFGFDL